MARKDDTLSKLSKNARVSLRFALDIAKEMGEETVTPMHIFLGVLLNTECLGSRTLVAMGVDTESTLNSFTGGKTFKLKAKSTTEKQDLNLSPESARIMRVAYTISNRYAHVYVGTEHLLLAILHEKDLQFTKDLEVAGLDYKFLEENLMNFATYPLGILAKPRNLNQEDMPGMNPQQSAINSIGYDLVAQAATGKLDPVVGRVLEIEQLMNVLSRRKKNNPIIVGEAGVGKTALVEGLAQRIVEGNVPGSLRNMRIFVLDVPSIIAGSKLRGDMEEKMMSVIKEVTSSTNIILFIDEIHTILSAGMPGGGLDIASILKPALLRDDFRVIGATTTAEYNRYFEEDNALARRFQPVIIEEAKIEDTVKILERLKPMLEKHHNVRISEEAIAAAVKLSDRYVSDRYLPDKAIDLIDEAAATRRLEIEVKYKGLTDIMSEFNTAVEKKEKAVRTGNMAEAKKYQDQEKDLKSQLGELEKNRSKTQESKEYEVGLDSVQKVVSKWTGIPIATMSDEETSSLLKLEETLSENVIGQEDAVKAVAAAVKRARTGISAADRPWASFLFLGPTGVGKTELAKVVTKELFGDDDRLIQIDMSELMEMHSVSKLIGSPPGYIGYREGGQLTEQVRKQPHSVILFDEIEKAHGDVLNILLQILEYGHLTDGKGRRVNFKNTIIILTSNIGAEEIRRDRILGFVGERNEERSDEDIFEAYDEMRDELVKELKNVLRPELINRLDEVVIFRALTRKDIRQIVDLLMKLVNKRLADQKVKVTLDKKVREHILKEGFSEEYGARPLRRAIQDIIETPLANYLLANHRGEPVLDDGKKMLELNFTMKDGEVNIVRQD